MALLILLTVLSPALPTSAHANLVHSDPEGGAVLQTAPQTISLEFSEEADPSGSALTLFNADGDMLIDGQARVDPASPKVMTLNLNHMPDGTYVLLPEGTYSAVWKAQSAVDGHVTNGSIGFSVGVESTPASLLPPPGTSDPATELPPITGTIVRWLGFLSAALAAGSVMFGLFVWRPAFHRTADGDYRQAETHARGTLQRIALIAIAILAVATLLSVLVQASAASGTSIFDTFGGPLEQALSGRFGLIIGARLLLLALLAFVVSRLSPPGTEKPTIWWAALALAGGVLLTFSLQSHSAALGVIPVASDFLHMAAMSAWVGGLLPLGLLLRSSGSGEAQNLSASSLIPRFSTMALAATATLALTGLYNALTHVQTWDALTDTTYGRALMVKVGLFVLILIFGAANLFALTPRLKREGTVRWFGRTIRTELAIGVVVLVATAVLTAVSPASEALVAQRQLGIHESAQTGGVGIDLRIAPGQVGYNEFGVDITDPRPGAEAVQPQVLLRFTTLSHDKGSQHDMGTTQVEAKGEENGRYTARGSYISMGGTWQVEVIMRRSGFDDVRSTFTLPAGTQ